MSRPQNSRRPISQFLAYGVAMMLALAGSGCALFAPGEDEMSAAMNQPTEGRVSRDQYGVYTLTGPPTLYERRQAIVDVTSSLIGK